MSDNKFERVEYDADPDRCQAVGAHGQCPFKRVSPSNYCPRHGANKLVESNNKQALRTYRLGRWEERKNQFADDEKIKSLREEIGLLRIIIEEIMKTCSNENELIINAPKISDLVMKVEKLVVSCNNLETKLGLLLDRAAIIQFASVIVEIVSEYVTDADHREVLSDKILDVVSNTIIKE